MTVLEAIQKSTDFLARKNIESPRLQSELLLAHLLKLPRMKLYLNFERQLSTPETDSYRELIRRRSLCEPLQHIIGSVSFCGVEIMSTPQALVPRPETELLAEAGWQFLNGTGKANPTGLDFGTGTGCIAILLSLKCPTAKITAVDISEDALGLARTNAEKNQAAVDFRHGNGFTALAPQSRFDLIISNPPYIATGEIPTLSPEVRADPVLALDGGTDGLAFYRMFATTAKDYLLPGGKIMMEFGDDQAPAIQKLFEDEKWVVEAVKEDYSHRARMMVATR